MSKQVYQIKPVFDVQLEHGEGPIWDEKEQEYYWVDLLRGTYFKGNPSGSQIQQYEIGQALGVMALREKGGSVMAVRDGFGFFNEKSRFFDLIQPSPEENNPDVRFNDGIVSPKGQFWAGTMEWDGGKNTGKLFRLNKDRSFTVLETDLFIPNGMGWNAKEDTFFMIDTGQNCVFAYDYDQETDNISNRRVHIQFEKNEFPDGMTIDAKDHFWIAMWEGGKILQLDASGKKIDEILLPVPYPTSCCFGGKNMDDLFITTSRLIMTEEALRQYPLSGHCLLVKTNSIGKTEYRFDG